MVYAIIRSGGKQQRVSVGDRFEVEKLPYEVDQTVEISEVLAVGEGDDLQVGAPYVEGAKVTTTVVRQDRAKKIIVGKYKRRKNYYRMNGHRQSFTRLRVDAIQAAGVDEKFGQAKPTEEADDGEE